MTTLTLRRRIGWYFRFIRHPGLKRRFYRRYFVPDIAIWLDSRAQRLAYHTPSAHDSESDDILLNASRLHIVRPDGSHYCHWFRVLANGEIEHLSKPLKRE